MESFLILCGLKKQKQEQPQITLRQLVRFPHYETIFKFVFFIMITIILIGCTDVPNFRQFLAENNYRRFKLADLVWLFVGIALIHGAKIFNNFLAYDFVLRNIQQKYTGNDRVLRAQKVTKWVFDTFYYFTSSLACYLLFRNEKWFPSQLGGTNFEDNYYGFPNIPDHPYLSIYYMIQTASHVHALLLLMIHGTKIELKYWEYLLHHTLAVSLLGFSTAYSTMAIGVTVLILHDISDFFLSLGRAFGDLFPHLKIPIYSLFSMIQISWLYTRVFIFPLKIFETINGVGAGAAKMISLMPITSGLLWNQVGHKLVLFAMHVYWTIFMVKVGLGIFSSGKYKNVYDNRENKLDHKKD